METRPRPTASQRALAVPGLSNGLGEDRFGVSWQIVPRQHQLIAMPIVPRKTPFNAMMQMKR